MFFFLKSHIIFFSLAFICWSQMVVKRLTWHYNVTMQLFLQRNGRSLSDFATQQFLSYEMNNSNPHNRQRIVRLISRALIWSVLHYWRIVATWFISNHIVVFELCMYINLNFVHLYFNTHRNASHVRCIIYIFCFCFCM